MDRRFAQLLDRVRSLWVQHAERSDEIAAAFVDEDGIEDVDLGLIYEKSFEEEGDDHAAFAKDEEGCVKPGYGPVEDR